MHSLIGPGAVGEVRSPALEIPSVCRHCSPREVSIICHSAQDRAPMWFNRFRRKQSLDPALCKGLHGVLQTGSGQKIDDSQLNSIDIDVIQEEDS
jgi:hypothetical protein